MAGAEQIAAEQERRRQAYRMLVQSPSWPPVLQEMLAYANRETGPNTSAEVRCGRLDMIAHILRAAGTTGNLGDVNGG